MKHTNYYLSRRRGQRLQKVVMREDGSAYSRPAHGLLTEDMKELGREVNLIAHELSTGELVRPMDIFPTKSGDIGNMKLKCLRILK